MSIPRATARLQFHKDFTLDDAVKVIDYYAALGVSHIYASPLLAARSGSMHGYDIVDPTRINPELGGEDALRRFVSRLREKGMGLIADIVPNHMGVSPENPWWQHVLEWGRLSPYAGWFDIDWQSADPALREKVLAPFLGQSYGDVLKAGEIKLQFDAQKGKIAAVYYAHHFPIAPVDYAKILHAAESPRLVDVVAAFEKIAVADSPQIQQENAEAASQLLRDAAASEQGLADIQGALAHFSETTPEGIDSLHELLESQHYRLTWWRNAAEEINWRRFFEVTDLAAVRVEQDSVFDATHALILRLYAEGLIDGVRIDHVDGLADPAAYCRKLRERLESLTVQRPAFLLRTSPYIIVEKILAPGEQLRTDWGVNGTTGYEFMDQVGALLHDPAGAQPLNALRAELGGSTTEFELEVRTARRQLLEENLVGEFDSLVRTLHTIARADLHTRDFSHAAIRRVLMELLIYFPVYRTYAGENGRDLLDQQVFEQAAMHARASLRPADRPLLDVLDKWLGGEAPHVHEQADVRNLCRRAITRFQQLTPPLAAKSVEDTAFYRYGRLLSRNEVGADPGQFALSLPEFHEACMQRARHFPNNLLATATHDHKRGEDVRTRLAVLSELPNEWADQVRNWFTLNAPLRTQVISEEGLPPITAPQPDDELMLYQMLVGAWPLDLSISDYAGIKAFAERIEGWQTKALREAKSTSSWVKPNEDYENACKNFLFAILDASGNGAFLNALLAWIRRIAPAGAVNSFTQTLLRLTSPGVPDLYQGTEFWDFSLVDPDNRRPVDYMARQNALHEMPPVISDPHRWQSGTLKQQIIRRTLQLRMREEELFGKGEYIPLEVEGSRANNVVAFMRRHEGKEIISIAARFPAKIIHPDMPAIPAHAWEDTVVTLPADARPEWLECLTETRITVNANRIALSDALHTLPVAVLYSG
ncbi:malto-oligosyltrehalose synthase [Oxalobacteraceae bacterium R-40]|uniref:Malto-oligosyltrehalose synthase n=1 Tax=Keguizhuia sedimenti TaxID=3064264 RepID=A0ABU1BND3_9BURK|nr:malto-oligosyltrehalose synthase [Oxalobacteraceae bacterium R-40]